MKEGKIKKPTYRQKFVLQHLEFLEPYIIPRNRKEEKEVEDEPTETAEPHHHLETVSRQVNYLIIQSSKLLKQSYKRF